MNELCKDNDESLPILYSLRNCPFAMRARLAIFRSQRDVILRSILLTDKPAELHIASPKATVPVLVIESESKVIDESFDVMIWALTQNDPSDLLHAKNIQQSDDMYQLIQTFDSEFKGALEQYKCAKRYHEIDLEQRRQVCEHYIIDLESRLEYRPFLVSDKESMADLALLPFIRQFARVERPWFVKSDYPNLKKWLNNYLQSSMFTKVMAKHPLYSTGAPITYFGMN